MGVTSLAVKAISLVLACAVFGLVESGCPHGWTHITSYEKCYKLMGTRSPATFDDASKQCKSANAQLAVVHTFEDMMSLSSFGDFHGAKKAWYDLQDKGDGSGFVSGGKQVGFGASVWKGKSVPALAPSGIRRCASIGNYTAYDGPCDETHAFMCEMEKLKCAPHWLPTGDNCMRVYKDPVAWVTASQRCEQVGAKMLKIGDKLDAKDIQDQFAELSYDQQVNEFWIGISDSTSDDTLVWAADNTLVGKNDGLSFVRTKTPNTQECGFISINPAMFYFLPISVELSTECHTTRYYACVTKAGKAVTEAKQPDKGTCEAGWTRVGDACLTLKVVEKSWQDARKDCKSLGGDLTTKSLSDVHKVTTNQGSMNLWIGLKRDGTGNSFKYIDGTPLSKYIAVLGWGRGYKCVSASVSDDVATSHFGTFACTEVFPYVCQKPVDKSGVQPSAQAPTFTSDGCGQGWERRPGTQHCYRLHDADLVENTQARQDCEAQNGTLVSITSDEEERFIASLLMTSTADMLWIGLREEDHSYSWDDQSILAIIRWRKGEPNLLDQQFCVGMDRKDMLWADYPCSTVAGYICEKKLKEEDVTSMYATPQPRAGQYYECDPDWLGYENRCFRIFQMPKTWEDARYVCLAEGGDLASVKNIQENEFLWSQLPSGCTDKDSDCVYWAGQGYCQTHFDYMSGHCQAACGRCSATCSDKQGASKCKYYYSLGFCTSHPQVMHENCAETCGCDPSVDEGYWIGLSYHDYSQDFSWSDNSTVKLTKWQKSEPHRLTGVADDCVLMHVPTGEWSDENCGEKTSGFICAKEKDFQKVSVEDPNVKGCKKGFGHNGKCFIISDDKKAWADAKTTCENMEGTLAILDSMETNGFVASEIYNARVQDQAWIGLSATGTTYSWTDGGALVHGTWSASHTGLEEDQCVSLSISATWNPESCSTERHYVCAVPRKGYVTPNPGLAPVTVAPSKADCYKGWTAHGDYCYMLETGKTASWTEARKVCENYGGSLLTIHDQDTNTFVSQTLLSKLSSTASVWIGLLQRFGDKSATWTDLSDLDFTKWKFKRSAQSVDPSSYYNSNLYSAFSTYLYKDRCGAIFPSDGTWEDPLCSLDKQYVCQYNRGGLFFPLKPAKSDSYKKCNNFGKGWYHMDKDYCYQGITKASTWEGARKICQGEDAELASVHNLDEMDIVSFLFSKTVLYGAKDDDVWIGLSEDSPGHYTWTDGSGLDFINFDDNEPNDAFGAEKCVRADPKTGKWKDYNCAQMLRYACKKRRDGTKTQPATLPPPIKGKCPDDFKSEGFSNKCFYVSKDKKNWRDAHKACTAKVAKSSLATIASEEEQAFVTLLLENVAEAWIGGHRVRRTNEGQLLWDDNKSNSYTNFGALTKGHYQPGYWFDSCVYMDFQAEQHGKWFQDYCTPEKAYVCQAEMVPGSVTDAPVFSDEYSSGDCKAGYFSYHGNCYKYVDDAKTWTDARTFCQSDGGYLATTFTHLELSRLYYELLLHKDASKPGLTQTAWLGVSFDETNGLFEWGDKQKATETFWGLTDPTLFTDDSCVVLEENVWKEKSCSKKHEFFCAIGTNTVPARNISGGVCPDADQVPYDNYCYLINSDTSFKWSEANQACSKRGMQLASIHSQDESMFLKAHMGKKVSGTDLLHFWIGLQRSTFSSFYWSDGTAFGFTEWRAREPSSYNENCVQLASDGKWNDLTCSINAGYICKMDKVLATPAPTVGQLLDPPPTPAMSDDDINPPADTHTISGDMKPHDSDKKDDKKAGDNDKKTGGDDKKDDKKTGGDDKKDDKKAGDDDKKTGDNKKDDKKAGDNDKKTGGDDKKDDKKAGHNDKKTGGDDKKDDKKAGGDDKKDDKKASDDGKKDDKKTGGDDKKNDKKAGDDDKKADTKQSGHGSNIPTHDDGDGDKRADRGRQPAPGKVNSNGQAAAQTVSDPSKGLSSGAVAGVVIGVLVGCALLGAVGFFVVTRYGSVLRQKMPWKRMSPEISVGFDNALYMDERDRGVDISI